MALLYNRISHKELKQRMLESDEKRMTVSFYEYFPIEDPKLFRDTLFADLSPLGVMGRIYVAHEGINAQMSLPVEQFDNFKKYINSVVHSTQFTDPVTGEKQLRLNVAVDDDGKSFFVLKIKVREKIVADGINDPSFSMQNKGKYLTAEAYNQLSENPDTIIVDMRNHYEYEVGHFKNAIEVPSDTFREQLPMAADMLKDKKDKPIIMYCTGGIRCEKASAYMLHNGFKNVYHIEGGIIHYANTIKEQHLENKFIGKNFVFDDRLGERIGDEIISNCHQCDNPADTHTNCVNPGCHLLFIQCPTCAEKFAGCCSQECYDIIQLPEEEQKKLRQGIDKGQNIFNKSRVRMNAIRH
ncbi:MAG TPA: rhodanese-related sulfurtransferase [Chitinophagales bacterium]|nr:rhodanese-related sulfurtransferase [Chitinophagales bacterium]HRH54496.1 rhodanese-related sulfurtransferase [Chitinophagales bacterium]